MSLENHCRGWVEHPGRYWREPLISTMTVERLSPQSLQVGVRLQWLSRWPKDWQLWHCVVGAVECSFSTLTLDPAMYSLWRIALFASSGLLKAITTDPALW